MFKLKNQINDSFFDNINGRKLDKYQRKVVVDNSNHLLVVAGAGSGKTLTIIAKVKYLIEKLKMNPKEILCLSFTNETVNNLKNKISFDVDIFTFHKLSLNILNNFNYPYLIANDSLLEYIVSEFFLCVEYNDFYYNLLNEYLDNKKEQYIYQINILKNNIISFIKKIKCNNIYYKKLYFMRDNLTNKDKIFLIYAYKIMEIYEEELKSSFKIDFDDMIIYATDLVKNNGIKRKYKYIIIDEYQDISQIRFNLIYEIIKKTNAKLMCVGDDYQSIYGFSGSNVSLFIDFLKIFSDSKRIDIQNTYRNSYELVQISTKFILKNHYQIRKHVKAKFMLKYPVVLVYYDNNYLEVYQNLLNYLYLEKEKEILVLGRYNSDLKMVNKINKDNHDIRYLTIHMSKGLESENVILLRFSDEYLGFPSKIIDNKMIKRIDLNHENMLYAEERRLFYVALTRCKNKIYIFVPMGNESIFIKEIKRYKNVIVR